MKKLLPILLATIIITSLTACGERNLNPSDNSNSVEPSPESTPESNVESPLAIDQVFIESVVLNFGAEKQTDDSGNEVIRPRNISLFHRESIPQGNISAGDIYNWYFSYTQSLELTLEEKQAKYKNPLGEDFGWFFPAEEYEAICMKYFDVTQEFLRSDSTYYNSEHNGYTVQGGGGIGAPVAITITNFTQVDDQVMINLNLTTQDFPTKDTVLTIKLLEDGYNYISYVPVGKEINLPSFVTVGYDKDEPGDLGNLFSLTPAQQKEFHTMLEFEQWAPALDLPARGYTIVLTALDDGDQMMNVGIWDDQNSIIGLTNDNPAMGMDFYLAPISVSQNVAKFKETLSK